MLEFSFLSIGAYNSESYNQSCSSIGFSVFGFRSPTLPYISVLHKVRGQNFFSIQRTKTIINLIRYTENTDMDIF